MSLQQIYCQLHGREILHSEVVGSLSNLNQPLASAFVKTAKELAKAPTRKIAAGKLLKVRALSQDFKGEGPPPVKLCRSKEYYRNLVISEK